MSSFNRVILLGYVGQDPDIRYTQNQQMVASFSMATNEVWNDKDGKKQEHTEWHSLVLWKQLAELTEKYVKKGSRLLVEGRLKTRSWDDPNGQKHYKTEIIADKMKFLGDRKEDSASNYSKSTENFADAGLSEPSVPVSSQSPQSMSPADDGLPF
ncbi:MAG: single-stranded DNA-binding protein [SAR324 cluster bacterium]|nr:single-stranded DNA-binding protein [SAR324 cluster bacterium]